MLAKIILEMISINFSTDIIFLPETRTRDGLQLATLKQQTKHFFYENYYHNRAVKYWNALPLILREDLVECENKSQIKKLLIDYLHKLFNEKFESDSKCTWFITCTCTNCRIT